MFTRLQSNNAQLGLISLASAIFVFAIGIFCMGREDGLGMVLLLIVAAILFVHSVLCFSQEA